MTNICNPEDPNKIENTKEPDKTEDILEPSIEGNISAPDIGNKPKDPENKKKSLAKEAASFVLELVLGIALYMLVVTKIGFIGHVPSPSMSPTLGVGDNLIISRLYSTPERNDIVVFNSTEMNKILIKRLVGLPGEHVKVDGKKLYVNDKEIKNFATSDSDIVKDFGVIPDNCYLFLGDNRANSYDARYWETKFIPKSDIIGKAEVSVFPFHSLT